MNEINTLLIMDLIILFLAIYLVYIAWKMNKTGKVERLVVPDEVMAHCKDEKTFAEYLARSLSRFSILLGVGGVIMLIHELGVNIGFVYYVAGGIVVIAFLWFYKILTDGKNKFC